MSTRRCNFAHCRERLKKRYGIRGLTVTEYAAMCADLRSNGAPVWIVRSRGDTAYVEFDLATGHRVKAVWCLRKKRLLTFLPPWSDPPVHATGNAPIGAL